jgi:hypothetical protein
MKCLAFVLLLLTGCSTAPVADLLDYFTPGKLEQGKVAPYGGVCGPQQVGVPGPAAAIPSAPIIGGPPLTGPTGAPQPGSLPPPDFSVTPAR